MKNNIQLITYADRLGGGDLKTLHRVLKGPLAGLFGGVHILPFYYPIHGIDAGFDPIDHTRIDPYLGSWADIKNLGQDVDLMADLIVNHVSASSPQFLDYSEKGDASIYKNMFLTMASIFPNGATEADLMTIYRPRPGLPFSYAILKNNQKRLLWTTFSKEQIDINVTDPQGQAYLQSVLQTLHENGIRMVRLDAVGYAIKKAGSSCFMIPETFDFIEYLANQAAALDIEILVEIHSHFRRQIDIAKQVERVYDFALPPLVLHAIFNRTARYLKEWLEISPRNAITVLDTHDGIGVIDIGADSTDPQSRPGIIPPEELDALVEKIHTSTNGQSRLATGGAASNLDLYQVNCTFYDALGRNDRDYLLARAIQFFAPGVPQVYYVGLLAGENDMTLLAKSGVGRDINRHYYTVEEIHRAIQRPVVQSLFELIRFRNHHPAFNGLFSMPETRESEITMRWDNGVNWAILEVDFASGSYSISNSPFESLGPK
ncbi:MAG TPA: sucrose phosphorylase [Anaerolineales bacterium]|nr:sucrose phosphorylase [Anaerolineales bacterium]